jgi:hypothetical protein
MASAWGSSWGSAWGNSWGSIDTLIGRKYRRGRKKRRYEELVETVIQHKPQFSDEVVKLAVEAERANKDLEFARNSVIKGKIKLERLTILEAKIYRIEQKIADQIEEDDLMAFLML